MMIKNLADLNALKEKAKIKTEIKPEETGRMIITVGMATCGIAAGAAPIMNAFKEAIAAGKLGKASAEQVGCIGLCEYEPIVEVFEAGKAKITYVKMDAEKAEAIIEKHIAGGGIAEEYTIGAAMRGNNENSGNEKIFAIDDTPFYKHQQRISLRNCGAIDPEDIKDYIAKDGYQALAKVLTGMSQEEVIQTLKDSGLRGRGGGGFPTGTKWEFAYKQDSDKKYVCCNADEGDPGAFMDRSIIEGDPHSVVEAMAIAGYAIGADEGYVYLRAEYPLAVKRLEIAIEAAKKTGLLGKNIFGTGFNFDLEIRLGAGAFVCGEETALILSIEGNRGEPRPRPPFPAVKGLFGKPTVLNNVETYGNIPQIILNGAAWFAGMGTEKSKGSKVFALGGKITNTGLIEIPMGMTLRQVVNEIGGGIPGGKKFKAAQTGGPSGGCIPAELIDTPIDYDNLVAIGSMMGSGGLIVMDEETCMVDIAKFFLDFTVEESCGKCGPCRIGTKRMYELLEKITSGNGELEDLDKLGDLGAHIKTASLCGLGQTAPNPVLSTMQYFRDEYISHVKDKKCSAGVCKDLLQYIINDKCIGCTVCKRVCPTEAISGERKEVHVIDMAKCIKCDACIAKCKFNAIDKI